MRRSPIVLVALAFACARPQWQGEQAISRRLELPPDSVVAAAANALRLHGYVPVTVPGAALVTRPHDVPQYTRPISTAPDTPPQQWLIEVQARPGTMPNETQLTVVGYLIPRAASTARDTAFTTGGVLVTSSDPRMFAEVRRIGNWIVDAAKSGR